MNCKETNLLPSFDLRLVLLSCLRISAVLNDIELSQDNYTQKYYNATLEEEKIFLIA